MSEALPIDPHVGTVRACLDRHRAAVLVAGPGAGKTTRVPPALVDRRPGDRAAAAARRRPRRRRADRRGARLDARPRGRLARALRAALHRRDAAARRHRGHPDRAAAAGPAAVRLSARWCFDEFHERSLHADLGLALARQAWLARDDLRLLVMSATLDAAPVARYLRDCPVVEVPGAAHPLAVEYAPGERSAAAVRRRAAADARRQSSASCPAGARSRRRAGELAAGGAVAAWRSCRCTAGSTRPRRTGRCGPAPPIDGASSSPPTSPRPRSPCPACGRRRLGPGQGGALRRRPRRRSPRPRARDRRQRHAAGRSGRAAGARARPPALGRARSAARIARARHRPGRPGRAVLDVAGVGRRSARLRVVRAAARARARGGASRCSCGLVPST